MRGLLGDKRRRWYLLALLWVVLMVVGVGGFVEQTRDEGLDRGFLDHLYLTLQLALLDYSGDGTDLNWRLEVARFAAPLMATGTLLQAASSVFREQLQRFEAGRSRGHVVVAGLGLSGTRLALELARQGRKVVGVDADPQSRGLAALRAHDVPAILGDPADPTVLRAARVDRAESVVALCDTDAQNVAVASAARKVPRRSRATDLRCAVHLEDAELTDLLSGSGMGGDLDVRAEFFNLHQVGARALLGEHLTIEPGRRVHLVVVGLGRLGRALVVAAAQRWAEVGDGPLQATLVDVAAGDRWHVLEMQHPSLVEGVEATFLELDVEAPGREGLAALLERLTEVPPTLVAVVLDDEALALSTGIYLRRLVDDEAVPVVVRTRGERGLGEVVAAQQAADPGRLAGLRLFPLIDRACTPALVEGGLREQLAAGLWTDHVARAAVRGVVQEPWSALTDEERERGRNAADGLIDAIAGLGFELFPLRRWGGGPVPFSPEEMLQLAQRDHDRWRAERAAEGWRYGEARDEAGRITPQLVPWDQLRPEWRDYNLSRIAALPELFARAGLELVRG